MRAFVRAGLQFVLMVIALALVVRGSGVASGRLLVFAEWHRV